MLVAACASTRVEMLRGGLSEPAPGDFHCAGSVDINGRKHPKGVLSEAKGMGVDFKNSQDCSWLIYAYGASDQGGRGNVTLSLDSLNVAPRSGGGVDGKTCTDHLKVYDACDSSADKLKYTLCGKEKMETLVSSGRCLYVTYHSDEGMGGSKGFQASFSSSASPLAHEQVGLVFESLAGKAQDLQDKMDQLKSIHETNANAIASLEKKSSEAGPAGPAGTQGEKGEKGQAGNAGPKGDLGKVGEAGAQGEPGPRGQEGSKGERGAPGKDGFRGARGLGGEPGAPGAVPTQQELDTTIKAMFGKMEPTDILSVFAASLTKVDPSKLIADSLKASYAKSPTKITELFQDMLKRAGSHPIEAAFHDRVRMMDMQTVKNMLAPVEEIVNRAAGSSGTLALPWTQHCHKSRLPTMHPFMVRLVCKGKGGGKNGELPSVKGAGPGEDGCPDLAGFVELGVRMEDACAVKNFDYDKTCAVLREATQDTSSFCSKHLKAFIGDRKHYTLERCLDKGRDMHAFSPPTAKFIGDATKCLKETLGLKATPASDAAARNGTEGDDAAVPEVNATVNGEAAATAAAAAGGRCKNATKFAHDLKAAAQVCRWLLMDDEASCDARFLPELKGKTGPCFKRMAPFLGTAAFGGFDRCLKEADAQGTTDAEVHDFVRTARACSKKKGGEGVGIEMGGEKPAAKKGKAADSPAVKAAKFGARRAAATLKAAKAALAVAVETRDNGQINTAKQAVDAAKRLVGDASKIMAAVDDAMEKKGEVAPFAANRTAAGKVTAQRKKAVLELCKNTKTCLQPDTPCLKLGSGLCVAAGDDGECKDDAPRCPDLTVTRCKEGPAFYCISEVNRRLCEVEEKVCAESHYSPTAVHTPGSTKVRGHVTINKVVLPRAPDDRNEMTDQVRNVIAAMADVDIRHVEVTLKKLPAAGRRLLKAGAGAGGVKASYVVYFEKNPEASKAFAEVMSPGAKQQKDKFLVKLKFETQFLNVEGADISLDKAETATSDVTAPVDDDAEDDDLDCAKCGVTTMAPELKTRLRSNTSKQAQIPKAQGPRCSLAYGKDDCSCEDGESKKRSIDGKGFRCIDESADVSEVIKKAMKEDEKVRVCVFACLRVCVIEISLTTQAVETRRILGEGSKSVES